MAWSLGNGTLRLKALVSCCLVTKQCTTLFCDPMDGSPPGSSVHGILQARILEWVAISFFRGSSRPRTQGWNLHLLHWQVGSLSLRHRGSPSYNQLLVFLQGLSHYFPEVLESQTSQLFHVLLSPKSLGDTSSSSVWKEEE